MNMLYSLNMYAMIQKHDIKLLLVIVTLLEAVIEEIFSGYLLGYSVSLGHQVTISWKLGIIWLFP